jgi:WD40 repeat protein
MMMARPESPLGYGRDEVLAFAADLRALRAGAGNPPYRELGRRANYSAAALSEAANGRKLPSLAVTVAYAAACGGDRVEWESRWRSLATEIAAEKPVEFEGPAPYVGLTAFQPADADRFFGRERLVAELVELTWTRRFVGVFGASGSGKSSVLRAGLVPRAERAVLCTPGPHPVAGLAGALAGLTGKPAAALAAEFAAYPDNLHVRVRHALGESDQDLLLVVDQFEEVFTLCHDPVERAAFIALLTTAAAAPTSRLRIVIGVRTDFTGHCGQHPDLVDALRGGQVLVGRMTTEELRRAITEPAAAAGCKVETALVTRLVADAAGQPAVLPLLSHALLETWRRRRGVALTLAAYESVGGVEHAIARTAERVHLDLDPARQEVARRLFLRLIAVGEGTEDTKRRLGRRELADLDTADVVDRLAEARLVALDEDGVELAHEALIRNWPRLRTWIDADRDGLRTQRRLTEDAETWESLDRDPGALYRGTRLALARDGDRAGLTPREVAFLDAGVAAEEAVHDLARRRTRRLRRLVALMAVLLLVAVTAVGFAFQAQRSATEQRTIALARKAISEAAALRDTDPALSVQLTLAAYRLAPTADTRGGLLGAFAKPYADRLGGLRVTAANPARDLVLGIGRNTPELWDVADPRHPVLRAELAGDAAGALAAAFSPDGTRLVTDGHDGVLIWNVEDPAKPVKVRGFAEGQGWARSLAFDPGGTRLAVIGVAGSAVWDVADPARPTRVADFPAGLSLERVVFASHDVLVGTTTASPARIVVWTASAPDTAVALPLESDDEFLHAVAAGPDGRTVAVADDRAIGLWDVADPRAPRRIARVDKHGDLVTALAFSPDGRTLASAGFERATLLWNVEDPARPLELARFTGHLADISLVAFDRGGRTLITAAGEGETRFTHLDDLPAVSRPGTASVVVAPARGLAAVVDDAGGVRLAALDDVAGPGHALPGLPRPAAVVAFTPDGAHLLVSSATARGGTLQVWRVADPTAPVLLHEVPDEAAAASIAVNRAGDLVATQSNDGRVRLWSSADLFGPGPLTLPAAIPGRIVTARIAFDESGVLALADDNGTVLRWDVSDPRNPRSVSPDVEHADAVLTLPSPGHLVVADDQGVVLRSPAGDVRLVEGRTRSLTTRGATLVVTGSDGTVHLWDLVDPRAPRELARLSGQAGAVESTALGADGHSLLTVGEDGSVRRWDTDPDRVAERVCAAAYPRMTDREWEQFFPDVAEDLPCR